MLGIKKCLLSRQKLESNHSGVEGSLIRPLNARFLQKKNDKSLHAVVLLQKSIDIAEGCIG